MPPPAGRAGGEQLVVAGGDGSLTDVMSGILAARLGERVALAPPRLGSGCDFARTLGLPRYPREIARLLESRTCRRADAGRPRYRDPDGDSCTTYSMNVASFGLSDVTDAFVERVNKCLGLTTSFALGGLALK